MKRQLTYLLGLATFLTACSEVDKSGTGGSRRKDSKEGRGPIEIPQSPSPPSGEHQPIGSGGTAAGSTSGGSSSQPTAGGTGQPENKKEPPKTN